MTQKWYVEAQGRTNGPYSSKKLIELAANGELMPENRISQDGKKWALAAKVKGLKFVTNREFVKTEESNILPRRPEVKTNNIYPGYEIIDELGSGGCGTVYRAKQVALQRSVALKVVNLSNNKKVALSRFVQESQLLAKLHHPNIVNVYDHGCLNEKVYLAMELLDGEDLEQRIQKKGQLDERTTWSIIRQTASALSHASELGIIHRDIKPTNLFLVKPPSGLGLSNDTPIVKVTDFGLAFAKDLKISEEESRLTKQGVILGTPAYMAPEQYTDTEVTIQTDIYGLGVTAYQTMLGRIPFSGQTIWDIMVKKNEYELKLPDSINLDSAKLIVEMMHPQLQSRTKNYAELIKRIDELTCMSDNNSKLSQSKSFTREKPKQKNRKIFAGIGLACLAFVLLAISLSAFNSKLKVINTLPENIDSQGQTEILSNSTSNRQIEGTLRMLQDSEKNEVIRISGSVAWKYNSTNADRISLGVDLFECNSFDVVLTPTSNKEEFLVARITKEGASIGTIKHDNDFTPLSEQKIIPMKDQELVPYLSVQIQCVDNRWDVWVENQHLGGIFIKPQKNSTPTIQVRTDGNSLRIERVELERLNKK